MERYLKSRFFNTLEWFSFIVNKNYVKDKKMIAFFKDAVIEWYEHLFLKYMPRAISDPKEFPEFKTLYRKFKENWKD